MKIILILIFDKKSQLQLKNLNMIVFLLILKFNNKTDGYVVSRYL